MQAANIEVCSGADTDSEDVPCESCEFVSIGGAITISQLLLIAPLSDFGSDIDNFSPTISLTPATDPDPPPPKINAVAGYSRVLCEELVLTGLPVRGPTVV